MTGTDNDRYPRRRRAAEPHAGRLSTLSELGIKTLSQLTSAQGNNFSSFGATLSQTSDRARQAFGIGQVGGLKTGRIAMAVFGILAVVEDISVVAWRSEDCWGLAGVGDGLRGVRFVFLFSYCIVDSCRCRLDFLCTLYSM